MPHPDLTLPAPSGFDQIPPSGQAAAPRQPESARRAAGASSDSTAMEDVPEVCSDRLSERAKRMLRLRE
jgi:hypothetical protein